MPSSRAESEARDDVDVLGLPGFRHLSGKPGHLKNPRQINEIDPEEALGCQVAQMANVAT